MQCRVLVAQLARSSEEFSKAGAQILVILGEDLDLAKKYANTFKTPFPILADPDREIYHRYTLNRFIGIQRTASMVLDREGAIRYIRRVVSPMPWLQEKQELLRAVQF